MTDPDMLNSLRYWSEHTTFSRDMRDKAIATARKDGATVQQIANAAGLSRQAIAKMFKKSSQPS
jgi:DNA-binding phage protein